MHQRRRVVGAAIAALMLPPQVAAAQTPSAVEQTSEAPPSVEGPAVRHPWFVHVNVGVPVYTTVGSWTNPAGGSVASRSFSPADRFGLVQLVGAGYWVHPNLRLNLSLQFAEMLTSQAANAAQPSGPQTLTGLSFMSAIAWAAFTYGPLFVGAGPMAGPRWMGNTARDWVYGDIGIFSCVGAGVPLPSDFALALAVQTPVTFNPAANFAIVPAMALSRRF